MPTPSSPRSPITTHVLDTARGLPATGIAVLLEQQSGDGWQTLGSGTTDADGRITDLLPPGTLLEPGIYRLTFATGEYFAAPGNGGGFYPEVTVAFRAVTGDGHYHVPLLLSPFGYSTYRGT